MAMAQCYASSNINRAFFEELAGGMSHESNIIAAYTISEARLVNIDEPWHGDL